VKELRIRLCGRLRGKDRRAEGEGVGMHHPEQGKRFSQKKDKLRIKRGGGGGGGGYYLGGRPVRTYLSHS